ncbi:proteasome subunit domain protein [Leptospira noguchii]|uniref:proteasome subunit domain protein n=1 Tax=Leptospira noguchii TaxID=28182 RepID=UPI001F5FA5A3|nr:proteasome subunit domain protein [Leptospira noguchii]
MASDSCATSSTTIAIGQYGNSNINVIESRMRKIRIIPDHSLVIISGDVGLGDRMLHSFVKERNDIFETEKHYLDIGTTIGFRMVEQITNSNPKVRESSSYGVSCLLAFFNNGNFRLCEYPASNFLPEFKSESFCFASVGVATILTEPLLAYASKIIWKHKQPTIEQAKLVAAWVITYAISFNTAGIRGPIQMATLTKNEDSNKIETHHFDETEILTITERVKAFEDHLASFSDKA